MSERPLCPPDYNGGFCADYDVDCKKCWGSYIGNEMKREETSRNTSNDLLAKIVEIAGKGYLFYVDDDVKLGSFRIRLVDPRTRMNLSRSISRSIFLEKSIDLSIGNPTSEVIAILDAMVKTLEEKENESKG